ncbi:MAG: type IV toxin-antitoxin system AbiEi family antitoxin domain-containing protein, partial [Enterococcus sp.]|nr:type IV toxin-antitoxin system AbiEi family antitoxin domain-containing protein [Enterococcus sp.]
MYKSEQLAKLAEANNGYLLTSAAQKAEISRTYLLDFVKANDYERAANGVYVSPTTLVDPCYVLQLTSNAIIASHESSGYLYGLIPREPYQETVTVKQGYNASHLKKKNVKVYYSRHQNFELGATTIKTFFGNIVRAYDMDRTICDFIAHKKDLEIQTFETAI